MRRATRCSTALGDESAAKASISAGVGGRPVRSSERRRRRVLRLASGAGFRPAGLSFARMNRSMGWVGVGFALGLGSGGRVGGVKAQWVS